jgi:IS5 family transposase
MEHERSVTVYAQVTKPAQYCHSVPFLALQELIPHRIYASLDKAHNARINRRLYNRRWMVETVFSSIKHTLGSAVRVRSWHLEFREMVLKCAIYNLRRTVRYS